MRRMTLTTKIRACQRCGQEYAPVGNGQKFCSICRDKIAIESRSGYKPKLCLICGQEYKPTNPSQKWCIRCAPDMVAGLSRIRAALWYKEHPEEVKAGAKYKHLKKYGMTIAQYEGMLASQGDKCAVCGKPVNTINGRVVKMAVDHDHKTGRVRGLLCYSCNVVLGHVKDNPDILARLIDYLHRP